MNLVTAKAIDQITLKGIKIDWQKHDGSVKTLTLTDDDGNAITIKCAASYSDSISVLIPEPPKMADKYVLSGMCAGIPIKKAFDSKYDAERAKENFVGADLTIECMSLPVDDDGAVKEDAKIPF